MTASIRPEGNSFVVTAADGTDVSAVSVSGEGARGGGGLMAVLVLPLALPVLIEEEGISRSASRSSSEIAKPCSRRVAFPPHVSN